MAKQKWILQRKGADYEALSERFGIDQVVLRVIRNRGVEAEDMEAYLYGDMDLLHDPHDFKDMDRATDLMAEAIGAGKQIRIIGDYDIDGVNSTYILYRGIKKCGGLVDYAIPHRIIDGYGLNRNLIDSAYEDGKDLIITCDNGISAVGEIAYAKEKGMTVIVTDHHDLNFDLVDGAKMEILPPADAVVNPKQSDCPYPFKGICGAVVAWKFIMVLYEKFGIPREEAYDLIENAAFATVGDVMDLEDENRIIVKYGLKAINQTSNPGMKALIKANDIKEVKAYHFGFVLGPCINASGRLDTAMKAMELMTAESPQQAETIAGELTTLNEERQALTRAGIEAGVDQIENAPWKEDHVYVVYLPDTHESIAGIVAGKLRERYYKPIFVVTGTGEIVKGSGRSIDAYNMHDEMVACKELFTQFGGHPKAAGFSLYKENLDQLRETLNVNETLTEEELAEKVYIDVDMPVEYASERLVQELKVLEPTGNGNPKPIFAENRAIFLGAKRMGGDGIHLRISLLGRSGDKIQAVLFSKADDFLERYEKKFGEDQLRSLMTGKGKQPVTFTYYPEVNDYKGRRNIQIQISDYLL